MPERTDQPQGQPTPADLAPQPNRILAEPATVQACAADYTQATEIRQTLAAQEARQR